MQFFTFFGCYVEKPIDLAVCKLKENPFTSSRIAQRNLSPVTLSDGEQPIGTPVAFTGFPLQYNSPITSKANIGAILSDPDTKNGFGYVIDKTAWPGASGSSLYLPDGKVAGIVYAIGTNIAAGLAYCRSAPTIVQFLARHDAAKHQKGQSDTGPAPAPKDDIPPATPN